MNNIRKSIGWADLSWNPIKGICPVGCWFCYARKIYQRFKLDPTPRLDRAELDAPRRIKTHGSRRIFVCSTFDLFHPISGQWRDRIFHVIEACAGYTFIILTKLPQNIDRPMPKNVWLGVSITGTVDAWRWEELQGHEATVRFVSFEPILGAVPYLAPLPDWAIIGRMTGRGKRDDPEIETLSAFFDIYGMWVGRYVGFGPGIPIFVKHNLAGIWPGKLIQEFPIEKLREK